VRPPFLPRPAVQDLEHLLRLDAANVGVEVEDKRQRSERLLSKAGNGELRAVRKRAGDGAAVDTVKDAQALREKARSLLKEAEGKKKLSKEEAKELENDLLKDINTQFGTRNENFALDVYERRCGTEVICSNERILVWPFPGNKFSGDCVPDGALDPPPELSKGWTKREARRGSGRSSSAAEPALPAGAAPERATGQGDEGQGQVVSSSRCADGPADDAAGSAAGNADGVKRPAEGKGEEVSPGFAARSRRGSCLPQRATPSPSPAATTMMTDGEDATTAGGQQEEGRRGSTAATESPAVAMAMAEAEDKRSSMTSSSTNGGSTAIASEGSNFGSIYSVSGTTPPAAAAAAAAAAAPTPGTTSAGLMNLETFGGGAVYAWGEGPADPSEPKEEGEDDAVAEGEEEEAEPEEQEWSVWNRDMEAVSPPPPSEGGGPQAAGNAGKGSGAGMEEVPARNSGWGSKTTRERRKEACFVVVGAVDGVAEEVMDAPEDAESWETRQVVVEVKNRMHRASDPPPLYDQIQLVTYMLMIGASVGDLVQFVKTSAVRGNGKRGVPRKEARAAVTATTDDVLVSRVELDCRTYRHRKHWEQVVLPRLYEFARMVYRFRGDDLLRWRYLLATPVRFFL
ncbi:unnamed protein product, partial [Ectocarpus fasciculatus]